MLYLHLENFLLVCTLYLKRTFRKTYIRSLYSSASSSLAMICYNKTVMRKYEPFQKEQLMHLNSRTMLTGILYDIDTCSHPPEVQTLKTPHEIFRMQIIY